MHIALLQLGRGAGLGRPGKQIGKNGQRSVPITTEHCSGPPTIAHRHKPATRARGCFIRVLNFRPLLCFNSLPLYKRSSPRLDAFSPENHPRLPTLDHPATFSTTSRHRSIQPEFTLRGGSSSQTTNTTFFYSSLPHSFRRRFLPLFEGGSRRSSYFLDRS
ncbi:hypothetical protein BDD12DRAFT_330884 [Trichophaea hybrida]|nr:hypothetical protein BDD12DRAFT_330884 [Trichophaea hybrida]